jgi:hypothetical protein
MRGYGTNGEVVYELSTDSVLGGVGGFRGASFQ